MKTKNRFAIFAAAFAVCAAVLPYEASAASEGIWRIDSMTAYPDKNSAAHIGDTVEFRVLLLNGSQGGAYDMPWKVEKLFFSAPPLLYRMKISGMERYAEFQYSAFYRNSFTELVFSYRVQPGDIALPMELVVDGGTIANSLLNLMYYTITGTNGVGTVDLSFASQSANVDGVPWNNNWYLKEEVKPGEEMYGKGPVYINTLDFDGSVTDNPWRSIKATTEDDSPRILIGGIDGDPAPTNGTVYVWISDETGTNISTAVDFGSKMKTDINIYGQKVLPVMISAGDTYETFTLKGLSTNGTGTAYIYLSSERQNSFATGGYLISNFTYRVVKVTEPPEPYVKFTIDKSSVTCPTNWEQHAATLTVFLYPSNVFNEAVTVNLGMKTATKTAEQLFATNSIRVSDLSTGTGSWLNQDVQVVVRAGESYGQAYIYALGAEKETITFTPDIVSPAAARTYYREPKAGDGCTLNINASVPVLGLLDPNDDFEPLDPPWTFGLRQNVSREFYISLADGYRCTHPEAAPDYKGYDITWYRQGREVDERDCEVFTNVMPQVVNGRFVLPVTMDYPSPGVFSNTQIRVTNIDGRSGDLRFDPDGNPITVTVGEAKVAEYTLYELKDASTPKAQYLSNYYYAEGETALVSFRLSEPYTLIKSDLYVFLEPINAAASNTTVVGSGSMTGTGVRIPRASTNSAGVASIKLNDGYALARACNPEFAVHFCTTETYDPDNEDSEYRIDRIQMMVTNLYPSTASIIYGSASVKQRSNSVFTNDVGDIVDGRFPSGSPVILGLPATFRINPEDVSTFDIGSGAMTNCLVARWSFSTDNGGSWVDYWKFGLGSDVLSNRCDFTCYDEALDGTSNNLVRVTLIDKDMREEGDLYWEEDDSYEEEYEGRHGHWVVKEGSYLDQHLDSYPSIMGAFTVSGKRTVQVIPSMDYFKEEDFINGDTEFTIRLSQPPQHRDGLDVKLHVDRFKNPPPSGGYYPGFMQVSTQVVSAIVHFPRGSREQLVPVTFLDGTDRTMDPTYVFKVWAEVVSTNRESGLAPYNELFVTNPEDLVRKFYVENTAPVISETRTLLEGHPASTNEFNVGKDTPLLLTWQITDVPEDITNNLQVTIIWGNGPNSSTNINYSGTVDALGALGDADDRKLSVTGSTSIVFSSPGKYDVSLRALDKDGQDSEKMWVVVVAASKNLYLLPHVQDVDLSKEGAAKTTSTTPAAPYLSAKARGVGSGRVWARGGALTTIENFKHQWVYNPKDSSAPVYGIGYAAMDREGSLSPNDQDIDSVGDRQTSTAEDADHYLYESRYDSFFYRWVINVAQSGGGEWNSTLQIPTPQYGKGKYVEITPWVALPEENDEPTKSYNDILVEAIFSKELYLADNMGDINADGIPDYYAVAYPEAVGTGSESGGSSSSTDTPSDLLNAAAYNGDGDFLPAANRASNPFNPGRLGWGPGSDFTFRTEIRGFGNGLNEPGVSEFDLTAAETMALISDWTSAGNSPSGIYTNDYAAATNWAKRTGWSCERRLDPTDPDTDGDGFDDGTEYFFWYYSRIGLMQDGSWKRMTGSKFSTNPRLLGKGVEIPSWAIAARFDPLSATVLVENGSRTDVDSVNVTMVSASGETFDANMNDFDNDGLYDLEELALGLNPVNWDSDEDGVPDLYELLNGLNPLDPDDGSRSLAASDFRNNPDRDFMAWMDSPKEFSVVSVIVGTETEPRQFALDAKDAIFTFVPVMNGGEPATNDYIRVKTAGAESAEYFVEPASLKTMTDGGSEYLAVAVEAFRVLELDGTVYLGEKVVLREGVGLAEVAAAVESVSQARLSATSLKGEEVKVNGAPVEAGGIEVFRYGNDSGPLVPVPLDGASNSKIDEMHNVVVSFFDSRLVYIHNQVFNIAGFDPRTGWNKNDAGYLASRWEKDDNTGEDTDIDYSGYSINTAPYTTLDEFLVAQYRAVVKGDDFRAAQIVTPAGTIYDDYDAFLSSLTSVGVLYFRTVSTFAGLPFAAGDGLSGTNNTGYSNPLTGNRAIHGADTDFDGIPDGWELYVNINPMLGTDATSEENWAKDGDELNFLEEFASTDSTAMYSNRVDQVDANGEPVEFPECSTIFANHPSQGDSGKLKNWYNKFFPTNPYDSDTDGDGVYDSAEGASRTGWFYVGRSAYKLDGLSFIYGEPTDNGTSRCIKGAGLNPCTVDTDEDIIPDGWEYEYIGVVVKPDGEDKPAISELDFTRITAGDEHQGAYSNKVVEIRGGMDGTEKDANYDYDRDGLLNYQEYLVQSLRHLRYDDAETPLMGRQLVWDKMKLVEGPFVKFLQMNTVDAEGFFNQCLAAGFTGSSAFKFRELGYFVPPPHDWDMRHVKGNYLYMFGPHGLSSEATPVAEARMTVLSSKKGYFGGFEKDDTCAYASTDPRQWDSDSDGMDDYYELFHGLNPLLGIASDSRVQVGDGADIFPKARKNDRISAIYVGAIDAWHNAWTGWNNNQQPPFDAMRFPWMIGTAECDADGDGLRNSEEAIFANITDPSPTHTDPTPLWMTDSTSTNTSSYVAQYYRMLYRPGTKWNHNVVQVSVGSSGSNGNYIFAFEENEGYDTDHDFTPDNYELTRNVSPASDPLDATDPTRRQGIWFSGDKSAAVSTLGSQQRPNSVAYDLLRQFTVEVWVKAENPNAGREQVILERAANYAGSSLSNAASVIRANFRLGINEGGRFFGQFDGSTANSGEARLLGPEATTNWTHLALVFDGSTFALHVNGLHNPVAQSRDVGLIPANGILIMEQEAGSADGIEGSVFPVQEAGYEALPCALLLGARAVEGKALDLLSKPDWDSYGSFFQGWVDEVRVWDGARTPNEINANYASALSRSEIVEARSDIFTYWSQGRRRNGNAGTGLLPAELLQHYNFSTLPGAVDAADVAVEPDGFTENVTDQIRVEGAPVPQGTVCGWWASTPVRSTVYNNMNLVPWIANTVAHLPILDGSAVDSQYWSKEYAGVIDVDTASTGGGTNSVSYYKYFDFPNTANPYPYYIYWMDRSYHLERLAAMGASSYMAYLFQLRSGFVGTSDLVPLGNAFAKRCIDSWDGGGAMDAWDLTVADRDADGLPDWWEALYAGVGVNPAVLNWDTLVDYWGTGEANVPAYEAYQRDLAKGMLPGGIIDEAYASSADINQNGMLDYWERMYGVTDAADDPDYDGLSNYAEYLSSEGDDPYGVRNGFWTLDPTRTVTAFNHPSQVVPDYFLPGPTNKVLIGPDAHGKDRYFDNWSYLGEIFSDHDFMEDWWERGFNKSFISDRVYDPAKDYDGDGWSNWAECRYAMWSGYYQADIVDSWLDKTADLYIKCYPRPAIGVRVSYNGRQDVRGKGIVVRSYTAKSVRTDSTFIVPGGAGGVQIVGDPEKGENLLYIGRYVENSVLHGFLNPGSILTGSGTFWKAPLNSENAVKWHYFVGKKRVSASGTLAEYSEFRVSHPDATLDVGDLGFAQFAITMGNDDGRTGRILHTTTAKKIGEIDYRTGEFTLDMAAIAQSETNNTTLASTVFAAQYEYQIGLNWPQTIYVSDYILSPADDSAASVSEGFVKEGKNTVEVFIDLNGNGTYDPGEPMGIAKNVDVSWHKTGIIEVEVTDTSAVLPRYDVTSGASDRMAINGVFGGVTAAAADETDADAGAAAADEGEESTAQIAKTVRIVRKSINGQPSQNRVLMSKDFILDDRAYIHEGDVLTEDRFDLDWKWLVRDAAKLGISPDAINTVTYAIEESGTGVDGIVTNKVIATFVNGYTTSRPVGTPVAPVSAAPVYSAAPKFSWTASDDTATAFRLQIRAKDADETLYDTGFRRMPGRTGLVDGSSGHQYTASVFVDMPMTNGAENVLLDGSNYEWRVALFNAKYRSDEEGAWSPWAGFQMDVRNQNRYPLTRTGYGLAAAVVRYYGPDRDPARTNSVGQLNIDGKVIVEAFGSADFSGEPLARVRADLSDGLLDSIEDNSTVNATLHGVPAGTVYLRAFIDANDNGKKDAWESWGYVNNVGRNSPFLFTPRGLTVPDSLVLSSAATSVIYIEDTDVNQNEIPDCLEFDGTGSDVFVSGGDRDGDGLTDDEEEDAETIATKWDTDGDGMPDGWEVKFADTDPGSPDGDEYLEGDMMAYEEFATYFVTLDNGVEYIVVPNETTLYSPRVNEAAAGYPLASWYAYGADRNNPTVYGLGTNVAVAADVYITNVETVRAARVHAQVYAEHGFESGVATAFDTVGRSKPFTALDKYLVARYLQAIGFQDVDENTMNTNGVSFTAETAGNSLWAKWTILPNTADGNLDGIADGWQLYVMFGGGKDALAHGANAGSVVVSPWTDKAKAREVSPSGGLSWLDEYDMRAAAAKYLPTDPWAADSDGDGISDADAYIYHIKEGNLRGDDDNDLLPNFVEFLVSRGFDGSDVAFPDVFADRRISHSDAWDGGGQLVPDYFLRVGSLYLGEMFTDHDFMESYLETSNEVQNLVGPLDSYRYDANADSDGDGWSNFSEMRAVVDGGAKLVDMGVVTNTVARTGLTEEEALALTQELQNKYGYTQGNGYTAWDMGNGTSGISWNEVTNEFREVFAYPGTPVPTVKVNVFYSGHQMSSNYTVKAWTGTNTAVGPEAVWTGRTAVNGQLVLEVPDSGALTEGKHTFVVYAQVASSGGSSGSSTGSGNSGGSTSGSGDWTPGAPYGIATDVDVGWKQAEFAIGLTDTHASVMRFDVAGMIRANEALAQVSLNDRGVNGYTIYPNIVTALPGDQMPSIMSAVRVRIVRNDINSLWRGSYNSSTRTYKYANASVYNNVLNLNVSPYFTELNLTRNSDGILPWDLDWANLATGADNVGISYADIVRVSYAIVIGNGTYGATTTNNCLATLFVNGFEQGALGAQTRATPVSPSGVLTDARPTFKWTHANTIGKAYPAFQLRVRKGSSIIYDSGVRHAPPRDVNGVYIWTPDDLHVGEVLGNGKVFENDAAYTWTVSMLDAKFYQPNSSETTMSFRTDVGGGALSGKGRIEVAVKYFGPVTTSTNTASLANLVRVEAFASPDFAGAPAAATYVQNVDTMSATNQITFNAELKGLSAGKWYLRAFIDTDGDRVRDVGESWGYGCYMGTDRKDVWTPRAYEIVVGETKVPEAVIYVEDVDADNDGLPDSYNKTVTGTTSPYTVVVDGNTASAFSIYANLDAGVLSLPYVSMLTHFSDDEEISALRLDYAMAMSGLSATDPLLEPVVRITSFSVDKGVDLAVDVPTAIDPSTLKATNIGSVNVAVTLKLWKTDALGGDWTLVDTQSDTFAVNTVDGKLDQTKLDALNTALKASMSGQSGFFKVTVE
jgi:uncharacterized protein (DUF2141 family)